MTLNIRELGQVVENPQEWLSDTKAFWGRPIIGCFPMRAPHELIDAAGAVPVDVYSGSGQMTAAAEYLQNIVCYPVRNAFERSLTGRLDMLDGAVFTSLCSGTMTGAGLWEWLRKLPYFHLLTIRHGAKTPEAVEYHRYEIGKLKVSLEAFVGLSISDDDIAQSIRLYNESRSLLDKLKAVTRETPDVLPAEDFATISAAAGLMPRSEYNRLVGDLLAALPTTTGGGAANGIRLAIAGSICDFPQFSILSAIREAGGIVVADDTPFGSRLRRQVAANGDPLNALVQHYFETAPCPTLYLPTVDTTFQHFQHLVERSRAAGLLILRPKYCDPLGLDYPIILQKLMEAGVPALMVDLDGRETLAGQVETRLQAFVEMLRE